MKTLIATILALTSLSSSTQADKIAHTESGETVVLHEDGSWTPHEEQKELSSTSNDPQFRNSRWGDSRGDVLKAEAKKPDAESDKFLAFKDTVAGLDVAAVYIFAGEKLTRSRYTVIEPHSNETEYITDYNNLKNTLSKKYGPPKAEDTVWKNGLYRDDSEEWGMALQIGHLVFFTKWETEDTEVTMMLGGDNYEINFIVEYQSKDLAALEDKLEEQETLNDL